MTDQTTTRLAEIRARFDALPTYVTRPWSSEYDSSGAEINFDPCHKVYDADAGLVFVTDAGRDLAALLQNAPEDLAFLLSLVEQLQGQLDTVKTRLAYEASEERANADITDADPEAVVAQFKTIPERTDR